MDMHAQIVNGVHTYPIEAFQAGLKVIPWSALVGVFMIAVMQIQKKLSEEK